ncbi:MAG: hypothetical protein Q4B39_02495 [[Ruminococcus] gnavus]|nr:hypothetical protein [Mediterraneibacter gnavus]
MAIGRETVWNGARDIMSFFAYDANTPRVIEYQCVHSYGYGVWGGKWLWKNLELFQK